ncbi:Thioesterase domain containing protein [Moelleriella libera RCEF 2490]|uniref:Thioesterase domain containing protein n=1 Tax=Moelleriella libera RCEF 2490 TaxID=1081109 RepID=A0A162IX94_9HYPO|nr:Thioesterase domain containing protein [Moelleriella libera RCEF 2490]
MLPEHVELVQHEDWRYPDMASKSVTPIFLIHDGGGTTFAYHCLESLKRLTYGIRNPRFSSGAHFAGGLAEMGSLYAQWIQQTVSSPVFPKHKGRDGRISILLGGWSLGGLLSLEVAKRLADDRNIHVAGIIMVDSIYPGSIKSLVKLEEITAPPEEGLSKNQVLSQRCMTEARRMVFEWQMPVWDGVHADKRPRAILLRATEPVPQDLNPFHGLDSYRDEKMLGWEDYDANMFDAILDVEGHHFDLFSFARVEATTAVIKRALQKLQGSEKSRRCERWTNGLTSCWPPLRA